MLKITGSSQTHPLHGIAATREMEVALARTLPPHTLMARAALAAAKLAKSIAPNATSIWVACGPGNNGGDGLLTAALLVPWLTGKGGTLTVTWCGNEQHMPADARWALGLARQAGVIFADSPPTRCDLTIDALLGIGGTQPAKRPPDLAMTPLQHMLNTFRQVGDQLLCLDIPSDLNAESGNYFIANNQTNKSAEKVFTITFLTIKPGLFTGHGRDAAGEVWFDDLAADDTRVDAPHQLFAPMARLAGAPCPLTGPRKNQDDTGRTSLTSNARQVHATHKGDFGDVWVVGGQGMSQSGHAMTGAALLAARAALHAGAGRVFVVPLDGDRPIAVDLICPELMFRQPDMLTADTLPAGVWVCGCGGGQAVVQHLPALLNHAAILVLDADALNAIAIDPALQQMLAARASRQCVTVLTPHPLEAARLLNTTASRIQQDRLTASTTLATQLNAVCVLKGSGTVIAAPGLLPTINPTGNAKLSTAGTGDVLAGMLGAALAQHAAMTKLEPATTAQTQPEALTAYFKVVCHTVWQHGHSADVWPVNAPLSASDLIQASTLMPFVDPR